MTRRLVWLAALAALAGWGDDFVGPCVPDDAGNGCDAGSSDDSGGGNAGTGGGGNDASTPGDASTNPGADTGAPSDDDAGEPPVPMDAAVPADSGMDSGTNNPDSGSMNPANGERLAPCEAFGAEDECDDGLGCYQRGLGSGFCTPTCEDDEDCEGLTDATYTCSTTGSGQGGPGGGGGLCRIECEGEDDTESCPAPLVCIDALGGFGGNGNGNGGNGGAFRCGYAQSQEPPGSDDVPQYGACEDSGDCVGDLVCYSTFQPNTTGFCTSSCETNDDCTEEAESGDIDPTCGTQNLCRFDCSEGGSCPDGMECVEDRCTYAD